MEKLLDYLNQKLKKEKFEVLCINIFDEDIEWEIEGIIRFGGNTYVTITCMEKWLLEENFGKHADIVFDVITEKAKR